MKIYNTLTQKKETFKSLEPGKVKMYACGITVSGEAHVGHFLQALVYDIMRKYLTKKGFNVSYCRNYTDIDDKIIATSKKLEIDSKKYAKMMIEKIDKQMRALQVGDPDIWMKATTSIPEIIEFIEILIKKNHAYATPEGDVYFSVESFPGYGKLSKRNIENSIEGSRIEIEKNKKNPMDFALWKSAKPEEPKWDSPWGSGRPGWHIECSAMNLKALGEQIDIHGGGRDLIFPHHENEIAQTEAYTGKPFVSYWTHNGLIKVNGQKMSKSLGNSIFLEDLIGEYHPEVVKFALLQTSYRNDINITENLFIDAERHVLFFNKTILKAYGEFGSSNKKNKTIDEDFDSAMDDDFNTAKAIANLFGYFKTINQKIETHDSSAIDDINQIRETYSLLGLFVNDSKTIVEQIESKSDAHEIPSEVKKLASERWKAKKEKEWKTADELRAKIDELGFKVKDSPEGYEIEKK